METWLLNDLNASLIEFWILRKSREMLIVQEKDCVVDDQI